MPNSCVSRSSVAVTAAASAASPVSAGRPSSAASMASSALAGSRKKSPLTCTAVIRPSTMDRSTTTSLPPGTLYSPCTVPFAVFIGTVYPNPGPGPSPGMTTGSVMDGTFSASSAGERVNSRPRLPGRWPARTKRSSCASLLAVQGHCHAERSNLSVNREVDTGWTPETSCGSAASLTPDAPVPQRRFYVPVRIKFCLSLLIALTWTGLSVWLSLPWVDDLGRLLGRPLALGLITFIRSEEHTSELQSLMRISYAVFCSKKQTHSLLCHNP